MPWHRWWWKTRPVESTASQPCSEQASTRGQSSASHILHNKTGLWDTQVSQGTVLPRPMCSTGLKSHQTPTNPKRNGTCWQRTHLHLCHDSRTPMGWTVALQPQTSGREQHRLPSYYSTQKSVVSTQALALSPWQHPPWAPFCWSTTQPFIKGFLGIYKNAMASIISTLFHMQCFNYTSWSTLPFGSTTCNLTLHPMPLSTRMEVDHQK